MFIALTYVFTAFVNIKLPIAANGGLIPVSYTHLDVYKRQLLVFLSDLVIHAIVNKKIILEDWLLVISGYTGWKASGGCFHVSIPMINPDHHNCLRCV